MRTVDAIVLGAGMAGVSVALQLQARGRKVLLVDRQEPGEATSYGNAGVIETDGFEPVTFPSDWRALLRYALNREPEVNYHLATLVRLAPWLNALRRHSRPAALARYAEVMKPLITAAGEAHHELAGPAGALHYYRRTGWIKLFRKPGSEKDAAAMIRAADRAGTRYAVVSKEEMQELEPHLLPDYHTAIHFQESQSVSSPGDVTKALARSFAAAGGLLETGDAATLDRRPQGDWTVTTGNGPAAAQDAVVALGPWSNDLLCRFGYRVPLAVKRGYHRHYAARGNAVLSRPIVDLDNGYAFTPMVKGIRLTSGIEFAERDAPPSPVQLARALPLARRLFPFGDPLEDEPWMGARPCMPDSMPVLGRAPGHDGLWFQFGHGHWGFSLGPVTGRLVAQLITGEPAMCDPEPLSARRFA